MTQYPRLLCLLVCLAVLDKALSGSNMGLRILKRDNAQMGRTLRDENLLRILKRSNPTVNLVNNLKKSYPCIIFIYFQDPILLPSPSSGYGDAVYRPEDGKTRKHEGPIFYFDPVNFRVVKTWYPGHKFKKLLTFWEHDILG